MSVNEIISLNGRIEIKTSITEDADIETILKDLDYTLPLHYENARKIDYLYKYWKGGQPILDRVKEVREDIDNKVIINLAASATRQITGYTFGKPIEFIHRKDTDEVEMEVLNNCFKSSFKTVTDNEIFTDLSVCGVGYRAITPIKGYNGTQYELGISPFALTRLDPVDTFCVYSQSIPKTLVYAVTYYVKRYPDQVDETIYQIYIGNREFLITVPGASPKTVSGISINDETVKETRNLLGIPIIPYKNNMIMAGDWELAISIVDALNVVASDSVNDIVQFVQSLLVFINAEMDSDKAEELKIHKMLSLISQEGLNADVKYIAQQLESTRVQMTLEWLEGEFDTVVGIPDRKTRGGGGGDTGEAVKLRDGWGDLEILARIKEPYVEKGEMETLMFAINLIKEYNLIEKLLVYDIEIKFSRNKSDNLMIKTQSYSNLIATQTITPEDAMTICDFVNDTQEVSKKGDKYWKAKEPVSEPIVDDNSEPNNINQ